MDKLKLVLLWEETGVESFCINPLPEQFTANFMPVNWIIIGGSSAVKICPIDHQQQTTVRLDTRSNLWAFAQLLRGC